MPPKVKTTKEAIVDAAVQLVRTNGPQAINARNIAAALCCSTQPVFSNFATMEELRLAVAEKAAELCDDYLKREVESGNYPEYKASGMAYIRFAKEEKELFKLLFMCDRSGEPYPSDSDLNNRMEAIVHHNTGLHGTDVKLFHLEMWACVHGIATMFATNFLDLNWEVVSRILSDTYQGMRKQYGME